MKETTHPSFLLSFDFEIGWGDVSNARWITRENNGVYQRLRPVLDRLLNEMDVLEFPATWATVGAMITAQEKLQTCHLPSDAKKTVLKALDTASADTFDGRDLFEKTLNARTKHSYASHSYTHIPFNFPGVNQDYVSRDLKLSFDALSQYGVSTDHFIFPENREGYYDTLLESNIRVVRVAADTAHMSRPHYLLSALVGTPPPCKTDHHENGMTRHYGSMLFNMGAGRYHRLPFVYGRAIRGLNSACKNGTDLHVWAHPFNFAESKVQLRAFISFLRKVAAKRDAGEISIKTMQEYQWSIQQ